MADPMAQYLPAHELVHLRADEKKMEGELHHDKIPCCSQNGDACCRACNERQNTSRRAHAEDEEGNLCLPCTHYDVSSL